MLRLLLLLFVAPVALAKVPPNVIVFLSDDQGWGDLSQSGNLDLKTPHIDSLAREGASFDAFFVCPVCSPTRAEFLTGRYHLRSGVWSTSSGGERMNLDETTIADLFRNAGYRTGAFGKWHNGTQYPYHPNGRGFDEFYGFCSGHWGHYFSPFLEHNGLVVRGEGFCADDFTTKAIEFMEASHQEGKPFFAYLPYNIPHSPMQVPEKDWVRFRSKELRMVEPSDHTRCALAMCENLDKNVGRVLSKLEQLELSEQTIVVWFHDNGPNGPRWNGELKGRKGSVDEGGCRSPLFIKWPQTIRQGVVITQIASARDLLPTLCELAGITQRPSKPLDGKSLVPLLKNPKAQWEDRVQINTWRGKIAVRSETHLLGGDGKLYDMKVDRSQRHPIENKAVYQRLQKVRQSFQNEFDGKVGRQHEKRSFVIAHPGSLYTQLPARDATCSGEIRRSNKFPNDSFFLNWIRTEDKISWDVESAGEGEFAVKLFYTSSSAGAKCRLGFKGNLLDFRIPEAHDVPLRGMEHDRSQRMESYTKDWKEIEVGVIRLVKGRGILTLEATEIPGSEVMEFRLMTLRRIP